MANSAVLSPEAKKPLFIYPTRQDPRWFQLAFLFSYLAYALTSPGFQRHPSQYLASFVTCLTLDVVVTYWNRGVILAPLSGLISSMGLTLLCDSPRAWPYMVVALLVIFSKQFIRIDNKHIFNPVNFGIVVGLLFMSDEMSIAAGRWGGSIIPMILIACLGLVVVWRSKRLDVSGTYLIVFFIGVLIRSYITGGKIATLAGPMTGAAFQLFTFFMISDPMTTPETRKGRIVYTIILAAIDNVLRFYQIEFAPFYALFLMSGMLPIYRSIFVPAVPEQVWATKTVGQQAVRAPRPPKPAWRKGFDLALGPAMVVLIIGVGWQVRTARAAASYEEREELALDKLPFRLVDATADAKLTFNHQMFAPHKSLVNLGPMIGKMAGASVAVVDFDNDGFQDVYLTNAAVGSKNALFRNLHDGTFAEVATTAGLAEVNEKAGSLRALFFDADNDGDADLFLQTTWCPSFFRNNGDGTFAKESGSGIDYCNYGYASNVVDYDGDGFLDLLVGSFYTNVDLTNPTHTSFMWNSFTEANNGGPFFVFHNEKGQKFTNVPGALGIKTTGFTHAIGLYDLDGSGKPDVYVATDFNQDSYFLDRGTGPLAPARRVDKFHGNSMNAEIADVDNDGRPLVFSTQIFAPGHSPGHNDLWKFRPDGLVDDVVRDKGVQRCGWAWGAKFVDLDNDSGLDLVVTNGFMTQNGTTEYWYKQGVMDASTSTIMADSRRWPAVGKDSMAQRQHKCVYLNVNGKFERISSQTPLGQDDSDGRGLASIDLLNDGRPSLVEANVNQPARFYRNDQVNENQWVGFALTGTKSNRDAIGARVTIEMSDKTITREVWPANGYLSQHDKRMLVGLGAKATIKFVTIKWPSGIVQTLPAPALGQYHSITEPNPDAPAAASAGRATPANRS